MTAESATVAGRELAARLMVDSCTITRPNTARTFNRGTGSYTAGTTGPVYSGPCQIQIAALADAGTPDTEGGGATVQQILVKVPVDVTAYRVGDLVTVTAAILDDTLVGRDFRVTAIHGKTFATARRLQCEEVTDA